MTATPPPKPFVQRAAFWGSIVASLVLAGGAVAAGYLVTQSGNSASGATTGSDENGQARPAPEASGMGVLVPSDEPATEASSQIPPNCADMYSTDWATLLGPELVLNPSWSEDTESGVRFGSANASLEAVLQSATKLTCVWANEDGGSGAGLTTNIAVITAEQQASARETMEGFGSDCFDELSGIRCVVESSDDGETWGESHFMRDGIWIATRWINTSPDGYTHDIVNTLWS